MSGSWTVFYDTYNLLIKYKNGGFIKRIRDKAMLMSSLKWVLINGCIIFGGGDPGLKNFWSICS